MGSTNRSHNKKRNTGLLYEFLVKAISRALVEGDQKVSSQALRILKKHFKPGTMLHREFRLINSLVKTTVSSEAVAVSIIQEAKAAARQYDNKALDREKSLLIRNINYRINESGTFYDPHVNEYKIYATIQTLLNDWRSNEPDLERLANYENQLVEWLVSEKTAVPEHYINDESTGTNRLLMKVMMKKLNEKYSEALNDSQRELLKAYAWSSAQQNQEPIRQKLVQVKDSLIESMGTFCDASGDKYISEKLSEVKEKVLAESLDQVDDDTVVRFMLYVKLNDELTSGDK